MGSTESFENVIATSNSQDIESLTSICSGLELRKSSSSTEIEYNEEGRCSKENANNIKNTQVEENCLADDLFGKNQASPSDCEKKMSEEKCKGDGETPRFKKLSYVSSSQPI